MYFLEIFSIYVGTQRVKEIPHRKLFFDVFPLKSYAKSLFF